jgi:hypothetical protein
MVHVARLAYLAATTSQLLANRRIVNRRHLVLAERASDRLPVLMAIGNALSAGTLIFPRESIVIGAEQRSHQ